MPPRAPKSPLVWKQKTSRAPRELEQHSSSSSPAGLVSAQQKTARVEEPSVLRESRNQHHACRCSWAPVPAAEAQPPEGLGHKGLFANGKCMVRSGTLLCSCAIFTMQLACVARAQQTKLLQSPCPARLEFKFTSAPGQTRRRYTRRSLGKRGVEGTFTVGVAHLREGCHKSARPSPTGPQRAAFEVASALQPSKFRLPLYRGCRPAGPCHGRRRLTQTQLDSPMGMSQRCEARRAVISRHSRCRPASTLLRVPRHTQVDRDTGTQADARTQPHTHTHTHTRARAR